MAHRLFAAAPRGGGDDAEAGRRRIGRLFFPDHAAQFRVALDRLRPEQAVIALVPDANDLPFLLACDHFDREIERHRLWFVAGEKWPQSLEGLFADHPGLCTPMQFIRLPIAESAIVDPLIESAQKIFATANGKRAQELGRFRESYTRRSSARMPSRPIRDSACGMTPAQSCMRFSGTSMQCTLTLTIQHPPRHWRCSAVGDCGVLVTANTSRADLANVLSESLPWITWASGTRIPNFRAAGPKNALITAYPQLARSAGWPANRIVEATFPKPGPAGPDAAPTLEAAFAIIINTHPLDPPSDLAEYSSHRVLWELIAADLHDDPFALTDDIDAFLTRRMCKLDIAAENFPRSGSSRS